MRTATFAISLLLEATVKNFLLANILQWEIMIESTTYNLLYTASILLWNLVGKPKNDDVKAQRLWIYQIKT